jgi:hypothetical protein
MRPIPKKMKEELAKDPFMKLCIHNNEECSGRIEWEHAWTYAGKQINEIWAIVPVCYMHHRGGKLDKDYNRYVSLLRASEEDLKKYPRKNWKQIKNKLKNKNYDTPILLRKNRKRKIKNRR